MLKKIINTLKNMGFLRTDKEKIDIKKIVLIVIMIIAIVMVSRQEYKFAATTAHEEEFGGKNPTEAVLGIAKEGEEPLPVGELKLVRGESYTFDFKVGNYKVYELYIGFDDKNLYQTTGSIGVTIYDEDGTELMSQEQDASGFLVRGEQTPFRVAEPLKANKTYKVEIKNIDIENRDGVYLLLLGDEQKPWLTGVEWHTGDMYKQAITPMYLVLIWLLIPWAGIWRKIKGIKPKASNSDGDVLGKKRNWISRYIHKDKIASQLVFLLSPLLCFYLVEDLSSGWIYIMDSDIKWLLISLNLFLYVLMTSIIYLIVNRTNITAIIVMTIGYVFSIANYNLLQYKGIQLSGTDLLSIKTGINVMSGYQIQFNNACIYGFGIFFSIVMVMAGLKHHRGLKLKKRAGLLAVIIAMCVTFNYVYLDRNIPEENGISVGTFSASTKYIQNGSLLSFVVTIANLKVEPPTGYSPSKVEEILANYQSDKVEAKEDRPNIIVVMNESFADLELNAPLNLNKDCMPFYHGMNENTVKGKAAVSVFGGGTCNSEFEFLTGCTMAFLPDNSYPYQTYLGEKTPSLTQNLKEQGYGANLAFHPFVGSGWNRPVAYKWLGFDEYIDQDAVEDPITTRGLISDKSDYDTVINRYQQHREETNTPFYTFNVTMQNHGGYGDAYGTIDEGIEIITQGGRNEFASNFVNLMKNSDNALRDLIEYYEAVNEKTVIVFFGDHQPSLGDEYLEATFGKTAEQLDTEDKMKTHTTPYFIWANYDIPEVKKDTSLNYLEAYLQNLIGGNTTAYEKYLLELQKKVPIITAMGYIGDDGNIYKHGEESPYTQLIDEYKMVQYNMLFDKHHWPKDKYVLK